MTATLRIGVRRLPHAAGLELPSAASPGSAGLDLRAAVDRDVTISTGSRRLVPTGLVLEVPIGWEAQVRPRSGLALKHGVTVLNAPGTIDSDYRGEVGVILINLGDEPFVLRRGDRIAQLLFAPSTSVEWAEVEVVGSTDRGEGGFGSSGD